MTTPTRLPRNMNTVLPHELTDPLWTHVTWDRSRSLLRFKHTSHRCPVHGADEVDALKMVDNQLRWNSVKSYAAKRRTMFAFDTGYAYAELPVLPHEDPLQVAEYVLRAWVWGDTVGVLGLTARRKALLPRASEYTRGHDVFLRLDSGEIARIWSTPKRGGYWVATDDRHALGVELLSIPARLADLATAARA